MLTRLPGASLLEFCSSSQGRRDCWWTDYSLFRVHVAVRPRGTPKTLVETRQKIKDAKGSRIYRECNGALFLLHLEDDATKAFVGPQKTPDSSSPHAWRHQ